MRNRFISSAGAAAGMAMALTLVSLTTVPAVGQATKTAAKSALPRTPDGHPDLQGIYDLATMTPMERLPGDPPVLSKEQAEKIQQAELARRTADGGKLDPNRAPLPVGGDKSQGKSFFEILEKAGGGAVGGYDRLWLNQGKSYTEVDGQIGDFAPSFIMDDEYSREIRHFVECIQTGTESLAPGEQGVTLMRIIDALYESAASGREVRLDVPGYVEEKVG